MWGGSIRDSLMKLFENRAATTTISTASDDVITAKTFHLHNNRKLITCSAISRAEGLGSFTFTSASTPPPSNTTRPCYLLSTGRAHSRHARAVSANDPAQRSTPRTRLCAANGHKLQAQQRRQNTSLFWRTDVRVLEVERPPACFKPRENTQNHHTL